jgi:hypothetical protein
MTKDCETNVDQKSPVPSSQAALGHAIQGIYHYQTEPTANVLAIQNGATPESGEPLNYLVSVLQNL